MRIVLIRHGLTAGNLEKRYIGRTDEPLCAEGIKGLNELHFPPCNILVCSPMIRCTQTAEILFPQQKMFLENDFRECDFGDFEGKNYNELSGNTDYQNWIDSGGTIPFPNGEAPQGFRERCVSAFDVLVSRYSASQSLALVVHGGTIMSILEKYAVPHKEYFDWHCENGHGYICDLNGSEISILERI